jgi:hypothetical protein
VADNLSIDPPRARRHAERELNTASRAASITTPHKL